MSHPIYHVRAVEIVEPYTLRVRFTDDTEQIIYLRPVLAGELYCPLLDLELFNQVAVDPEVKRWCGRTAPTLIQRRCTIGRSTKTPSLLGRENGNEYLPNGSPLPCPEAL
jgi:Protein of unknown function (DUF2442)